MADIKSRMRPNFACLEGGLFSAVTKADVGSAFSDLQKNGVALMGWADPFYPDPSIPPHILEEAVSLIKSGFPAHYTMPIGNPELKEIIAEKLRRDNGFTLDAQRNIIITPGSDSALLYAMMPFIGPDDEVLVPDPSYPSNFLNPALLGGVTVPVPLNKEDDYQPNVEEFRKRLSPKTKMVLLTNPNNPTTTVFTRESLAALAAFIVENNLVCVCDEVFESTLFDHREMVSIATMPGMWQRTLSIYSISKSMGLSGFRVGYIVTDDVIMDVLYGGAVNVLGATNTLAQQVAMYAFRHCEFIAEYNEKYDARRRYAYKAFNAVPGVSMAMPQATFLGWIDVSRLGDSSEISTYLIQEAKVACNDGKPYGKNGAGHLRLVLGCYWNNEDTFAAVDRMCAALAKRAEALGIQD